MLVSAKALLVVVVAAAAGLIASSSASPQAPGPAGVSIKSVAFSGTGCPANSATAALSQDTTTVSLLFTQLVAQVGLGAPPNQKYKSCVATIALNIPPGYSYAVSEIIYMGSVTVATGASALRTETFRFSSVSKSTQSSISFSGPTSQGYDRNDVIPTADLSWSGCGTSDSMIVTSVAQINGVSNAFSTITVDSTDGMVTTSLGLLWRTC